MRPPAAIVPWLDLSELPQWAAHAPTKEIYQRRLAIWWTACHRWSAATIARLLPTSTRSVRRWIQTFNTAGPAALDGADLGGRHWANLSLAAEREVLAALRPQAQAGRLVTITEVRATVEARVGRPVSTAYLYTLLHRHGWRKLHPRPRHPAADAAAQAAYKQHFPALVARLLAQAPRRLRPCVLFEDEARFGRISTLRTCWAPPDIRPLVGHQQVREYRDALVAANPWDGRISALIVRGGVDHHVMNAFLAATRARFPGRYCVMFFDGAGAHTSGDLVVPQDMHVEWIPPRSPELNPVESLWDYVREHYFGNRVFATIGQVGTRLNKAFRELDATPEVVRSITAFNWVKAAKLT